MAFGLSAGAAMAVGVGGSALLGGLAGAKGSGGGTSTTTSNPWGPQQEYLKYGFGQAQDAYKNASGMGAFTGQRVAGLNPFQTQGADFTGNYALGSGAMGANALGGAGLNMLNSGMNFGANANNIFNQSSMDPTQMILGQANQYANNPYVDGLINASGRDVTRQLNEQALPSLARGLSGTGNTNSTRGGVESAILQRGAADRLADTSSNIRSQFFGTGLGMAQNQYNQGLQNMLASNNQLLQGFNAGSNGIIQGQQAAGNVFDQANAAGGLYQGQNQAGLDAAQAQFTEQRDLPMQLAGNYMQTVDGNFGGTTSSTTPKTGGGLGGFVTGALGGGLAAFGTAGKLGGFGTTGASPVGGGGYGISPYGSGYSNTGFRF